LAVEEPGQASPLAAGSLNAPGLHPTQTLGPLQQRPIADRCGRNLPCGEVAAQLVEGVGHMNLAVGVDADGDPARLGVCDGGGGGRLPS
jgi:hypothetical protein